MSRVQQDHGVGPHTVFHKPFRQRLAMHVVGVIDFGGGFESKRGIPNMKMLAVAVVVPLRLNTPDDTRIVALKHMQNGMALFKRNGGIRNFVGHPRIIPGLAVRTKA